VQRRDFHLVGVLRVALEPVDDLRLLERLDRQFAEYDFRTLIRLRMASILRSAAGLTCRSKYASRNAAT
jgi:hypothetical protein